MSPILWHSDRTARPLAVSLVPGAGNAAYQCGAHRPGVVRLALRYRRSASENVAASGRSMPFD